MSIETEAALAIGGVMIVFVAIIAIIYFMIRSAFRWYRSRQGWRMVSEPTLGDIMDGKAVPRREPLKITPVVHGSKASKSLSAAEVIGLVCAAIFVVFVVGKMRQPAAPTLQPPAVKAEPAPRETQASKQARIQEEQRLEAEKEQRRLAYQQKRKEEKALEAAKLARLRAAMKTPLDAGAMIYGGTAKQLDALAAIVRLNRYRCDSISGSISLAVTRGFKLSCNAHRYTYDIVDKGGRWTVTVQ